MLSYRHSFHAGNHTDVLKHTVFVALLRYLAKKDKPFMCIDTHAGPVVHDLEGIYARKNKEFETGISRLWAKLVLPPLLDDYRDQVRALNPNREKLRHYPGSPQLALQLLRRKDALRLIELHSTESANLEKHFRDGDKRVQVTAGDGFERVLKMLPPPQRRALVLIDPSYEVKDDYAHVPATVRDALKLFATGTYMVWHPLVQRRDCARLPDALKRQCELAPTGKVDWLHVTLNVKRPAEDGFGLHGSGLFIVNPPWTLPEQLRETMPWLVDALGQDDSANFSLDFKIA